MRKATRGCLRFMIYGVVVFSMSLFLSSSPIGPCFGNVANAGTLKIGLVDALTGFGSEAHIHIRDGAILAANWINEHGGIKVKGEKYQLKTLVADGKGTVVGYMTATKKLVYEDKIKFLLGGVETPFSIAIGSVTRPAKVLRVAYYTCAVPDELSPKTPYTFVVDPGTIDGIISSLDFLVKKYPKVKTISVINPGDGSAKFINPFLTKEAEKRGLRVIDTYEWPFNIKDWYPVMTKMLTKKPDAILHTNGWGSLLGEMVKASRQLGFRGPIIGANYTSPYALLAYAGKDAATNYFGHGWTTDTNEPDMPAMMKRVIEIAKAKLGKFNQWNLWGWNGVWCLAQAIEHSQSLDPTQVAEGWRNMKSIETVFGKGKMGGLKTYGVNQKVISPVEITGLMNGKVIHVGWVHVEIP